MDSLLALILGGGAGSRLFPLTLHRSKPAVPLAGKYRLIDIAVSNCINSDINRIFILTQFNSASLNRHISNTYNFDRFRRGFVSVLAAEQTPSSNTWYQGTADAVRRSMHHWQVYNHRSVLITAGDHLYRMNFQALLNHHRTQKADITIATVPVVAEDAPGLGILKTGENHAITEFYEKPARAELAGKESRVAPEMEEQGRVYLASMGMYIFERETLKQLLDKHPEDTDFGRQIIPRAIGSHRIVSYPFEGYWRDIGTIRSFFEAHMAMVEVVPPFDMYDPLAPIYSNARMLPPAKVQNAQIVDSLIGEASIIVQSRIERSVIGIRSYIGPGTTILNSVIVGSAYFAWYDPSKRTTLEGPDNPGIHEGSVIENTIVDRNVRIGRGCRITNAERVMEGEGPGFFIRDGIVVIPKNATIPDGTVI